MKLVTLIKICLNETCRKVHMGRHVSCPKIAPYKGCFIAIAVQICSRICQEDQVRLKLTGIYQLLVYADDLNLLGDNSYDKEKLRSS
jgi:hypothetical protein